MNDNKMVEVSVRFWTDKIAPDNVAPKNIWSSGVVKLVPNRRHGITAKHPVVFNSMMELPAVIEKILIQHNIQLHTSRRERKYRP